MLRKKPVLVIALVILVTACAITLRPAPYCAKADVERFIDEAVRLRQRYESALMVAKLPPITTPSQLVKDLRAIKRDVDALQPPPCGVLLRDSLSASIAAEMNVELSFASAPHSLTYMQAAMNAVQDAEAAYRRELASITSSPR